MLALSMAVGEATMSNPTQSDHEESPVLSQAWTSRSERKPGRLWSTCYVLVSRSTGDKDGQNPKQHRGCSHICAFLDGLCYSTGPLTGAVRLRHVGPPLESKLGPSPTIYRLLRTNLQICVCICVSKSNAACGKCYFPSVCPMIATCSYDLVVILSKTPVPRLGNARGSSKESCDKAPAVKLEIVSGSSAGTFAPNQSWDSRPFAL